MTDLSKQKIKSFRLHKGKSSIKQIGLVVVVALFFIGLVWLGDGGVNRDDNIVKNNLIMPQITQVAEEEITKRFPDGVLLESKIKITEAYSATYPNLTAKQATVSFESSKPSKENYEFYKEWADRNTWQIINFSEEEILYSLYLRKNNEDLNITITGTSVNISYVITTK